MNIPKALLDLVRNSIYTSFPNYRSYIEKPSEYFLEKFDSFFLSNFHSCSAIPPLGFDASMDSVSENACLTDQMYFLDASTHLYTRVYPSIRRLVRRSVHPLVRRSVCPSVRQFNFRQKQENLIFLITSVTEEAYYSY